MRTPAAPTELVPIADSDAGKPDETYQLSARFFTPWLWTVPLNRPLAWPESREKHERFRVMTLRTLREKFPEMEAGLEKGGAAIWAMPGRFYVAGPALPTNWVEVPQMSAEIRMTPWREAGESQH